MKPNFLFAHALEAEPSAWLCHFSGLIRPAGRVLDLACGSGRNARWLAAQGFTVEAVDRDAAALDSMQAIGAIHTRLADLEQAAWPYAGENFDAIVVCRYLHRPLLPLLAGSLAPGAILIYETFMCGHESYGRPRNPDFLLRPNELLQTYGEGFMLIGFEQGVLEQPKPALMQRICAKRVG